MGIIDSLLLALSSKSNDSVFHIQIITVSGKSHYMEGDPQFAFMVSQASNLKSLNLSNENVDNDTLISSTMYYCNTPDSLSDVVTTVASSYRSHNLAATLMLSANNVDEDAYGEAIVVREYHKENAPELPKSEFEERPSDDELKMYKIELEKRREQSVNEVLSKIENQDFVIISNEGYIDTRVSGAKLSCKDGMSSEYIDSIHIMQAFFSEQDVAPNSLRASYFEIENAAYKVIWEPSRDGKALPANRVATMLLAKHGERDEFSIVNGIALIAKHNFAATSQEDAVMKLDSECYKPLADSIIECVSELEKEMVASA